MDSTLSAFSQTKADGRSLAPRRSAVGGALSLLTLLALFVFGPRNALAQDTPWKGNSVNDIDTVGSTDNSTGTQFYLYNIATGMFLNQGGYWGTSPDVRTVGLPLHLYSYDATRSGDSSTSGGGGADGGGDQGGGPGGGGNGPQSSNSSTKRRASTPGSTLTSYGSSTSSFPYQLNAGVQKATDEGSTETTYTAFLGYITQTSGESGYDYYRAMLDCTTGQGLTGIAFVDASQDSTTYYICLYAYSEGGCCDRDSSSSITFSTDNIGYLCVQLSEDGTEYEAVVKYSIHDDSLAYAQWQIVTLQDLIDNFQSTEGSFASPVDATFLVTDPNFHRRNTDLTKAWEVYHSNDDTSGSFERGWQSEINTTAYAQTDTATVIASMGFIDGIAASDSTLFDAETQRYFCRLYGKYYTANILWPSSSSSTDSITVLQAVTPERKGWYEVSCKGFQYGDATGWLYANVTGSEGTTQNTSALVALYSLDSTSEWEGIEFNESTNTDSIWGSADITNSDSVTARAVLYGGQLLTSIDTYEEYEAIAYVYVDSASTEQVISLGVVAGKSGSALGWVAFDDVQLRYLGNATQYIVLDETDTQLSYPSTEESEESEESAAADDDSTEGSGSSSVKIGLNDQLANAITYGKNKANNGDSTAVISNMTNYTLVLSRPLVDNQWNSLVLPVDLTPSQLLGAFGANYRLAQFTSVEVGENNDAQTICFTSVAHTDSLHAGYLYIVKPQSSTLYPVNNTGFSSFTTPMPTSSDQISSYQKDISQDYYLIPQVSFPQSAVNAGAYEAEVENEGIEAMESDSILYFHGTYLYQTSRVPTGSYVVGRIASTTTDDDGNESTTYTYGWYHYTGSKYLTIKGFRTWIDNVPYDSVADTDGTLSDNETEGGEVASVLYFTIDGAEDETLSDAVSTGLVSIPVANTTTNSSSTSKSKTDNRVYSLSGQLIQEGSSLDNLAKGIYLLNGQKYIVK